MTFIRISQVTPVAPTSVRLTLTDGSVVDRELGPLLNGPLFEKLKADPIAFAQVSVDAGTVVWPNGADLCPDTLIWGGSPPEDVSTIPPRALDLRSAIPA